MNWLRSGTLRLAFIALCSLLLPLGAASTNVKGVHALTSKQLSFEPNRGQTAAEVAFVSHGKRSSLFLTPAKAVLSLLRGDRRLALEMRFKNANPNPGIEGTNRLPGTVNYFAGADARTWHTAIPRYGRVLYRGIYPGIDLTYYGTDRQLEYDFVVAPGADPRAIRLELAGQDKARIDKQGDLVLLAGGYELRQHKPVVYQDLNGRREAVEGRYLLRGRTLSFEVGSYDRTRALVIDPLLGYSSYLGGNNEENNTAVATDQRSNVYLAGSTISTDFPLSPGAFQGTKETGVVYVTKIDPDAETLIYSAHLGRGTPNSMAVDAAGNAYVTGRPNSGFPVTPGAAGTGTGAFVAKLNPDGTQLLYSTIVPGGVAPESIALDQNGAAYIGGATQRALRTTPGALRSTYPGNADSAGFVAKVNADGKSFGYVTYFGSPVSSSNVFVTAIAADSSGNAYITGNSRATDLPVTANAPQPKSGAGDDAFVFKLNTAGSAVLFGTYLGGIGSDLGMGIALDGAGNIYVAGRTTGFAFPTTAGAYRTSVPNFNGAGWVVKYSPDYKLLFSSYIASITGLDGLAVDSAGNSYLTGDASSNSDLAVTSDAVKGKPVGADGVQSWVAKLDPTGTRLLYGTYFGGTKDETAPAIAVDPDASIYITGRTFSTDLPVALNPVQKAHDPDVRYRDAYVAQFVEPPWFDAERVLNAGSFRGGAVAAGEIVTIYGSSLGPKVLKTYNITAGKFDTTLARTKITFDGVPAPIIYASWGQTSVVVPYSVAGKRSTQVVVEYKGRPSSPVTLQVVDAAPGIFTAASTGSGQAAALLWPDYSVNGPGNPVPRGGVAMVYMTVGGENGADGLLAPGIAQHPMTVTATVGGLDAQVIYAGPSPGLIWGLTQVNVIVPQTAPVGSAVPTVITFGNRSTQAGVTIAVK